MILLRDFRPEDNYFGEELSDHHPYGHPELSWIPKSFVVTAQIGMYDNWYGYWGEPGAYMLSPFAAAAMDLGSYSPRVYKARFFQTSVGNKDPWDLGQIGFFIRAKADLSEYLFVGFAGPMVAINDSDPRSPEERHYPSGSAGGAPISSLPEAAQPIPIFNGSVIPDAYYFDFEVWDDGQNITLFSNGIKLFTTPVPYYLENSAVGFSGADYSGIQAAICNLEILTIPKIDFEDEAIDRLLHQYKEAENLKSVVRTIADQCYYEVDTLETILSSESLSTAIGEQLDGFGKILNLPRGSLSDSLYRTALYLKIYMVNSEGTIEDLVKIFGSLMNSDHVEIHEYFPAAFSIQASVPVEPDMETARTAVELCKAAGVEIGSLSLTTSPAFAFAEYVGPDETAGFDDGTGTVGGVLSTAF